MSVSRKIADKIRDSAVEGVRVLLQAAGVCVCESARARARASEDKDEHEDGHWRSGILTRWVGPWGDSCMDFSRYSPGPSLHVCRPARAARRLAGVAGLSVSEVLKIRRLSWRGSLLRTVDSWPGKGAVWTAAFSLVPTAHSIDPCEESADPGSICSSLGVGCLRVRILRTVLVFHCKADTLPGSSTSEHPGTKDDAACPQIQTHCRLRMAHL